MNTSLRNTFIILIFIGLFFSYFQYTINHLAKFSKIDNVELSLEDIDNDGDDSEAKKTELDDDYFLSEFLYSFSQRCNLKIIVLCQLQMHNKFPVITINTPPPKV